MPWLQQFPYSRWTASSRARATRGAQAQPSSSIQKVSNPQRGSKALHIRIVVWPAGTCDGGRVSSSRARLACVRRRGMWVHEGAGLAISVRFSRPAAPSRFPHQRATTKRLPRRAPQGRHAMAAPSPSARHACTACVRPPRSLACRAVRAGGGQPGGARGPCAASRGVRDLAGAAFTFPAHLSESGLVARLVATPAPELDRFTVCGVTPGLHRRRPKGWGGGSSRHPPRCRDRGGPSVTRQ